MSGQTGVNSVTLSSSSQELISGANPTIDRNINLQYTVPASKTQQLMGKPSGTYTTTVTYSFIAL